MLARMTCLGVPRARLSRVSRRHALSLPKLCGDAQPRGLSGTLASARRGKAARCVVAALPCLLLSVPASEALAHGEPPTAHAVVSSDAQGPVVVNLNKGLAQRRASGRFQFLCPASWGLMVTTSANEVTTPAAALPDGTVVLGASAGLSLLSAEGVVSAHPDARAEQPSTELVSGKDAVYALRAAEQGSEIVSVTATEAKPIWSDPGSWYSLGATDSGLVVMRVNDTEVEQRTLSFSGEEMESVSATLSQPIDYVFVRTTPSAAYALLLVQSEPRLGRVTQGAFEEIAMAQSSIAGPLVVADEELVAIDGELNGLRDGALTPITDPSYVLCLEQSDSLPYACTRTGIDAVAQTGVGSSLFALTSLIAPDYALLSDETVRGQCEYQWEDLRFDLVAVDMEPLPEPDAGVASAADAGAAGAAGDAGAVATPVDAGTSLPADAVAPGLADASLVSPSSAPASKSQSSGCSVRRGSVGEFGVLAWLGAGLLVCLRRRRRRLSARAW